MSGTTRVRSPGADLPFLQPSSTKFFGTAVLLRFVAAKAMLVCGRERAQVPEPGESLAKVLDRVCIPIQYRLIV